MSHETLAAPCTHWRCRTRRAWTRHRAWIEWATQAAMLLAIALLVVTR